MKDIPETYPTELKDGELVDLVSKYTKRATLAGRSELYSVGPSYWREMASLGQIELSNRVQDRLFNEIKKLTTEIELLRSDNKKSGRTNLVLSFVTIALALITGYLGFDTLEYSKQADKSEYSWKSNQIKLMQKTNEELQSIREQTVQSQQNRKSSTPTKR